MAEYQVEMARRARLGRESVLKLDRWAGVFLDTFLKQLKDNPRPRDAIPTDERGYKTSLHIPTSSLPYRLSIKIEWRIVERDHRVIVSHIEID